MTVERKNDRVVTLQRVEGLKIKVQRKDIYDRP